MRNLTWVEIQGSRDPGYSSFLRLGCLLVLLSFAIPRFFSVIGSPCLSVQDNLKFCSLQFIFLHKHLFLVLYYIQLILEQQRFELCKPSYMPVFFNKCLENFLKTGNNLKKKVSFSWLTLL